MRIEAYNQVAQLYQTSNTKNTSQAAKTNSMGRDEVQISSTGRDFNVAKAAVSEASDIREDKVNDIVERMKSGTYNVPIEDVADNLVGRLLG